MPLKPIAIPEWARRLSWQTFSLAVVACGMIHIVSTLVIPQFARANAFQRMSAGLVANRMHVMPAPSAERPVQPLPFLGADDRLAVCRFDVSQGPVEISVVLPERGWMLGLYTADGDNFYVIPAQDLRRLELTLTLVPATERFLGIFSIGWQPDTTASQVSVPQSTGYVVVRAAQRGRAYLAEVETALARAQCGPKRR